MSATQEDVYECDYVRISLFIGFDLVNCLRGQTDSSFPQLQYLGSDFL